VQWVAELRASVLHPKVLTPAVLAGGAIAATVLGLADVSVYWILAGTVALTLAGYYVGSAFESNAEPESRIRDLGLAIGFLVLLLAGSWIYPVLHRSTEPPRYFTVAGAKETQCLQTSSRPGSRPGNFGEPLCGGTPYLFDCELDVDGVTWLRRSTEPPYWVPRSAMQPVTAEDAHVRKC
jgi:hypothetical protein